MAVKNILAIIGSASKQSSNLFLIKKIEELLPDFHFIRMEDLSLLPHFDPEQTTQHTPKSVLDFREKIALADAVIICTPEYIFSIPSGLKNAFEWCVATTVFSLKPVGLITASTSGTQAHEQLQLLTKTLGASISKDATLLIKGIKSKVNSDGLIIDAATKRELVQFCKAFKLLAEEHPEDAENDSI